MSKVISVENLTKEYRLGAFSTGAFLTDVLEMLKSPNKVRNDNLKALDNVSFSVSEGDVLGIVGGNGAGKSTLLKILSRVTSPSSGVVRLNGKVSSLLEVGTGFHPELTGRENIYLNGTILGMKKREIDQKIDSIIAFSGVERFIETPIKRYSSGMIVRLGFAIAAFLEPEILIIDEVLAVGDAEFQSKCIRKVREISKRGKAVLFVSHNLKSVKQICSRAILMSKGSLILDSNPDEVIASYLKTGTFLGHDGVIPEDYERRFASREVLLSRVALINESFEFVDQLLFREPLRFQIELKKYSTITDAYIAIVVLNTNREKVAHCDKEITDLLTSSMPLSLVADLNVSLIPGKYTITCSVFNSQGNCYDDVEDCYSFSVIDVPYKGGSGYLGARDEGYPYSEIGLEILR